MIGAEPVKLKPKERGLEDVKREYADLCAKAGDIGYIIEEHKAILQDFHVKLLELKKEYAIIEHSLDEQAKHDESHPFTKTLPP